MIRITIEIDEQNRVKIIQSKKERVCKTCGKKFMPLGNCQKYCCEKCGMKSRYIPKKLKIEYNAKQKQTIDEALKEIEERNKQPIDLSKN
jgi:hypothetical protein